MRPRGASSCGSGSYPNRRRSFHAYRLGMDGRAASPPEAPRSQRLPDTSFLPLEKRLTVSRQWLPHPLQRRVLAEISRERREADVRGVGTAPSGVRLRASRAAP